MVRVPWTLLLLLSLQRLMPTLAVKPPRPGPIFVISWIEPDVVARDGLVAGRVRAPWLHGDSDSDRDSGIDRDSDSESESGAHSGPGSNSDSGSDSDSDDPDYHWQRGYPRAVTAVRDYVGRRSQDFEDAYLYQFRQGQYGGMYHADDAQRHAVLTGLEEPLRAGTDAWDEQRWTTYMAELEWQDFNTNDHGPEGDTTTTTHRPQPDRDGDGPQLERPSTSGERPAGQAGSGPPDRPGPSRERPAGQDGRGPQLDRPEVNQDHLRQWAGGEFGAVSCAAIVASLSLVTRGHNELRAVGDNDCHQARQMAESHIATQRQLQNMDFAALAIPDALRPAQASGLMTPPQCAGVMAKLAELWHEPGATKDEASRDQCARLAKEVALVEPSACSLDYIDIDFLLADERWAGTDHMMDLVLHGSFAKSASEPIRLGNDMDRGWRHTQRIDLQKEFNAAKIPVRSITGLQLWSGKDQLWVKGLRLRGRCAVSRQDMDVDKFANLDEKMSAKEWSMIWSGEIRPQDWSSRGCEDIDRLELDIQLQDEAWAGTDDALDVIVLGEFIAKGSHSIHLGRDMNRGWRHREKIPMSSLNSGPLNFTGARHITGLELRSASGDQVKLESIKVKARCAGSFAEASIDHKWESIGQWVEADKEHYGKIWYGAIEAKDWTWRPPCYEFDQLKVAFHLADVAWAGTNGEIHVNFNSDSPKTKLADNPDRDHRATVDMDLGTVFGKKVIPVDEVKQLEIWTGTDEIRVESLQLLARCAKSGKEAVFNRYTNLDAKMAASSDVESVWRGEVSPTGWDAKE